MTTRVSFDPLRVVSASTITVAYKAVGTVVNDAPRFIKMINETNGDVVVTDDVLVEEGKMFFPKNSFAVYDLQANMNTQNETSALLPRKTQFSIKIASGGSIPTSGNFYIEVMF